MAVSVTTRCIFNWTSSATPFPDFGFAFRFSHCFHKNEILNFFSFFEKERTIFNTGTGRCGTTFLIKLFSFLNYNTGFNKTNYETCISKNCNSGMESDIMSPYYIIKSPYFLRDIRQIVTNEAIKIKLVIIPIRDFIQSAKSRVLHKNEAGGLWNASNLEEQVEFYEAIMANYRICMTTYNINTIFVDFDQMISDKQYLYEKLKVVLDEKNINFQEFSSVYDEVTVTSAPHKN